MTIKVHGVSLHYFNEQANSDKYYRMFIWADSKGAWCITYHWGRDGAKGQMKTDRFFREEAARHALELKVRRQVQKDYEFLGQGEIEVDDIASLSDIPRVAELLHNRVGREPTKLPTGFQLIIREEEDVEDLLSVSDTAA